MNEVKRRGLLDRLRAAWWAFTGKPKCIHSLDMGVQIKFCRDCERGNCEICCYKEHSEEVSKLPDCNDCGKRGHCEYEPELGQWCRINCPLHVKEVDHV